MTGEVTGKMTPDPGFLWGAATSGHQIEGGNEGSDWWAWEAEGRVEGGVRSGLATDHWNRFREDLRLARELGLNSYRFSVEWSRIEPEEGRFNGEALDWYETLVGECESQGLLPMLTLHHFTSPLWFARQGGFASEGAPVRFGRFVSKVIERVGARVPLWCTLNEPMVLVAGTYLGRFMPPAEYAPRKASEAARNLLRAHVLAYDLLHSSHSCVGGRKGPWRGRPLQVGFAHNLIDFEPDRPWHPLERAVTSLLRRFHNRAWLDAVTGGRQHLGVTGIIPFARQVPEALGRVTTDFIGVNYYTKGYVQWRPRAPAPERPAELPVGLVFARRQDEMSDLEWAIHPEGLGRMLRFVRRYGLPVLITENGIADREDRLRARYIEAHLREVDKAVRAGIPVQGYYHWSLLDNFEWIKGFGPRFGLYRVDYRTYERKLNPSARVYSEWIRSHTAGGQGRAGTTLR